MVIPREDGFSLVKWCLPVGKEVSRYLPPPVWGVVEVFQDNGVSLVLMNLVVNFRHS